jgi:hypothetical protein
MPRLSQFWVPLILLSIIAASSGLALAGAERSTCEVDCLQAIRVRGDLGAQRAHVWAIFAEITRPHKAEPAFAEWHGEAAVFDGGSRLDRIQGPGGFARPPIEGSKLQSSLGVPVLAYSLFNDPAFEHIRRQQLYSRKILGGHMTASERSVPAFPTDAIVAKTVWWPIAHDRPTAIPVWDPADNPPRPEGNPYTSWRRVVAIDATRADSSEPISINFAGKKFLDVKRVTLKAFYHIKINEALAKAIMRDPEGKRAILIALGRPLEPGDLLALVGINMMSREIENWIWAAFWWHDLPSAGPFAAARPESLNAPWSNYLMQAAFDAQTPLGSDGGAHIAFNPWLEGRFPDGGSGGGTVSNCLACHQRASYPPVSFLPVTRGVQDLNDPGIAFDRRRTSFLWSLALHAQP